MLDTRQTINDSYHTYRQTKLFKCRFDKRRVLSENLLQVSSSAHVSQNCRDDQFKLLVGCGKVWNTVREVGVDTSARQSDVWICVHKEFHVEHISHFLWVEDQDPLEEDHICWVNCDPVIQPENMHMGFYTALWESLLALWKDAKRSILTWNEWQSRMLELQQPFPPRCPLMFCTLTHCRMPLQVIQQKRLSFNCTKS